MNEKNQVITNIIPALLSVLCLSLPWLGGPGHLLLFALVPLLIIQQRVSGKSKVFPYILCVFLLWNIFTVLWIKNATWAGAIAAISVNTFISTASFMGYHYVWKRAPKALAYTVLVSLWIAFEYLYINGELTFPWLILGNGFAGSVRSVQWYSATGILGGSLWILISNIVIYESLKKFVESRKKKAFFAPAVILLFPLIVSLISYYRYEETNAPLKVEVIQPNFDPYEEKFDMPRDEQLSIMLGLANNAPSDVGFIVMPETSVDDNIREESIAENRTVGTFANFLRTRYPSGALITGAETTRRYYSPEEATSTADSVLYPGESEPRYWYDHFNTAIYIDASGNTQLHHKSKLVAGAETIPFRKQLKFLRRFSLDLGGYMGQYGIDDERTVFTSVRGEKAGVAVCYESVYGEYFTEYIRNGAQVMFIITNDGWWGDTQGYRQHFRFARLRAIETRRDIARSANTGISGFIDQRGNVVSRSRWDERVSLSGTVNLNDKITFYTLYGDLTGRIACYVLALCALYYIAYRFRRKDRIVE